jgi:flagellar motor switch protein FliG
MITNASAKAPEVLPGVRKAAIVLISLGDQVGADLLRQLSEDEVQLVSQEIARLQTVSGEQAEAILEEFYQLTITRDYLARGGIEYARKMLYEAFGAETARRLLDRVAAALGVDLASFDVLQRADPQQLAKFVHSEHPQTIALILSHLNPSQAASLLISLPTDLRADVALRMASLDQISPDIINKIATVLGQKLRALGEFSRESYGGVRAVAELFNRLDSTSSKEILDRLEAQDPNLGATIRHLMFVFEDLLLVPPPGMKELMGGIDRKILTVALKGTSEELRAHFMSCMSQRGADMLKEDMDALGPVRVRDVETAQQQIIELARQLEADGVISLKGAVGEQYVV